MVGCSWSKVEVNLVVVVVVSYMLILWMSSGGEFCRGGGSCSGGYLLWVFLIFVGKDWVGSQWRSQWVYCWKNWFLHLIRNP